MTRAAEAISTPCNPKASAIESRRVLLQINAIPTEGDVPRSPIHSAGAATAAEEPPVEVPIRSATEERRAGASSASIAAVESGCRNAVQTLRGWSRMRPPVLRSMRPVPRKLWILMIALTCVSFTGLVLSQVLWRDGGSSPDEHEIVDEFKESDTGPFRIGTPTPAPTQVAAAEMQPLSVPVPSPSQFSLTPAPAQSVPAQGAPVQSAPVQAAPFQSAPVQSAIYQSPGGKRVTGAWLEGTIIEDEFDAPATNVNYDTSRPRPQ